MKGRNWNDPALLLGVWLAGALVFFRDQWTSGFNRLMGNDGDTRLIAYICEHWFRVFHGQDSWLSPAFFYPVKGLLGWSDTFLLYEVFYAPLRLVGLDPFVALQVTVILLSLVGFVSFVTLVRLALGTPRLVALVMGLVFTFSNALWLHAGSFQDNGIYLVPLLILLAIGAYRAGQAGLRRRSIVSGASFGLLLALLLLSTYYTSYFSLLAAAVVILVALGFGGRRFLARTRADVMRYWPLLAVTFTALALGLVPFLVTYLPARRQAGGTTYGQVLGYAGRLHDLVNVSAGNTLWGSAVRHLGSDAGTAGYEHTYATTPILMLAALVGGVMCLRWVRNGTAAKPLISQTAVVLAVSSVVVALLPIQTPIGSLWAIVYHLPGASAMRAIDRIQIVTGLLVVLALTAVATEISAHRIAYPNKMLRFVGSAVIVLTLVEQLNTTAVSLISDKRQSALLGSATRAPASCRSFYVVDSAAPEMPFFEFQLDAMLVGQRIGLPTVNGYTGYNPSSWDLEEPGLPGYSAALISWAELEGVANGLCELDLAGMRWSSSMPRSSPKL